MTRAHRVRVGFALALLAGCSPFEGYGTGTDSCAERCEHTLPADARSSDRVFVVRSVDQPVPTDQVGKPVSALGGLDLDGRCSAPGGVEQTCQAPQVHLGTGDLDGCIDNALAQELVEGPYNSQFVYGVGNDRRADGINNMALHVADYDGSDDDPRVTVSVFVATTGESGRGDDTVAPKWDRTDRWNVYDLYVAEPPACAGACLTELQPKFRDDHAFVREGVLHVSLEELEVSEGSFYGVQIRAPIERSESGWAITTGTVGGRFAIEELAVHAGTIFNIFAPCPTRKVYEDAAAILCRRADVDVAGYDDGTRACDGISFGWQFHTVPGVLHGVIPTGLAVPCELDYEPTYACP